MLHLRRLSNPISDSVNMNYLVSKYAITNRKTSNTNWTIGVNIYITKSVIKNGTFYGTLSTKPTPGMQFLHSLQRHACGTHFLINVFTLFNKTVSLNDVRRISHIFRPRHETFSLPWCTVLVKGTLKSGRVIRL